MDFQLPKSIAEYLQVTSARAFISSDKIMIILCSNRQEAKEGELKKEKAREESRAELPLALYEDSASPLIQ